MPKSLKVVDLNTPVHNNDNHKDTETNSEKVSDFPNEQHLKDEAVKQAKPRKRTSRSLKTFEDKHENQHDNIPVENVENNTVEMIEDETEPAIKENKKDIKTVELVACPKCGKKVTERTLKFSHPRTCPKNENKQKQVIKQESIKEEHKPVLSAHEKRMLNIKEKQDRIKQLILNAI